jgi:hypothetical protein
VPPGWDPAHGVKAESSRGELPEIDILALGEPEIIAGPIKTQRKLPDCHEQWAFVQRDGQRVQRLVRLVSLCPDCHQTQHVGRAIAVGLVDIVFKTMARVNEWTVEQTRRDIELARQNYDALSAVAWDLNLSVLKGRVELAGYPELYVPAGERVSLDRRKG